jgi:hypothetical protein
LPLLAGRNVQRYSGSRKRALDAAPMGIVPYMLRSTRACREVVHFATLVELLEAWSWERETYRRREILLMLIRQIHLVSLKAMTYKIKMEICSKSNAPDLPTTDPITAALRAKRMASHRSHRRK